jgi:two-component system chemotaxis response regulator CheY
MELQTEVKSSPARPPAAPEAHGEVRPEWTPKAASPARGGSPLVEVPPLRPVAASPKVEAPAKVEATAVPAEPPPRPAPAPAQIAQAIKDLISLLPGKPTAIGLENGLIGIVMCLDPATQRLAVPFLEEQCGYQPYNPSATGPVGPPLDGHILIVEDAYISRLVLRRVVEQLPGCVVTEAVNGFEAMELLKKGLNPDLMITDVFMPEMDGMQLLSRIRATPYLADLEVMMCTSATDRDTVVRAAELNVNKYLVKPFQPDEIRQQIRAVLTEAMAKSNERVQALKDRLGLDTAACAELFHQLAEQVREEVKTVRNELGAGKAHAALLTLQRLRGTCSLIRDNSIVGRVQTVINAANANDLFAIVNGLEVLESEGKRLSALADKLRRAQNPEGAKKRDPLAEAAARVQPA